ncbi:MAG: hypothetical protein A3F74_26090 [Betaproteobacteria bacterium RIFCSPLOWO2_12_FULL_62_58]|nr:MAG: hypothetical protein A3F74_26090 [Betaproteobacteria bacterium RIFCSPLOWO2_12_FULL_62_58]
MTDERRNRLRAILSGTECVSPATVYDPFSARIAEEVGYEIGMLAGSVSSITNLAAPDVGVVTLTEFADQIRRLMRVSKLSLLVDADQGFGNALNVMRTVQELEHAGASALTIEDTVLPKRFRQPEAMVELISIEEMAGKLRAALHARRDPSLVIASRIAALKAEDSAGFVARAKAYAATGVDAIFVTGLKKIEDIEALRAVVKLPIITGFVADSSLRREDLAARGVRIMLLGHQPVAAAALALREVYTHLFSGGAPADLKCRIMSSAEMERLLHGERYKQWSRDYLH